MTLYIHEEYIIKEFVDMGQFDISGIKNQAIREYAQRFDTDGIAGLSKEELTLFQNEARKDANITDPDLREIMGYEVTATTGMTEKQAKKYNKEANEAHINYLKTFANEGVTKTDVLKKLDEKSNLDPEFRKAVADVLAIMPAAFESSDSVKHKELMKKLEEAGLKDDLHENILKELEKMAKNECKQAKMSEIADAYAQKLAADPTKTSQQIMNEIKKEAKDAGNFKGDFKEAFGEFNQPMIDAYNKVYAAIAQIADLENGAKVQDKAEEILKANGQWDKYTKKALLGDRNIFKRFRNFLTGYKGDGRIASDNQGRFNKVEHKKAQTTEEIMNSLGNKTELFVALREAGIIKETPDGKWDLSELSNLIATQVGANYKLDRHHSKDELISEKLKTTSAINALKGLEGLDEDHAMALVKLCGFEIEGKNIGKAIFRGILGMAGGAASSAASTYGAGQAFPKTINLSQNNNQSIDISAELAEQLKGKLPEGVTIDATGNITIATEMLIQLPRLAGQLSQLGLYSMIPGGLIGGALGILSGMKDSGETPVLSNNFTEKTFEAYCERLEKENPKYGKIGVMIAASFIDENGNWNREGYKDFLNTMGGDGGLINREELIGGLQKRQGVKAPEKKPEGQGTTPVDEEHAYAQHEKIEDIYSDVPTIDGRRTGWIQIAGQYGCLVEKFGPAKAIRIIKIAQAITNGDYSEENLEKLYALSKKGTQYLKNVEGINYDVYVNTLKATSLGSNVKVPTNLAGCTRDESKSLKPGRVTLARKQVRPRGSAADRIKTGRNEEYYARFDGGANQTYTTRDARDNAVNEFRSKHKKVRQDAWETK